MELLVSAVRINGDDNIDITLVDPAGAELPVFTAGAHIDIRTPGGSLRQYSLCGDIEDRRAYTICVRKDAASRGGSRSLHNDLRVRAKVEVSQPRNLFNLPVARRYILVSAGIGITPVIAMARQLLADGATFELHHFERSRNRVAFCDELTCGALSAFTHVHLGDEGASFRTMMPVSLRENRSDTVVLACGPNAFLDLLAARMLEAGWDAGQLHCERFRPAAAPQTTADTVVTSFEVEVASTGKRFTIGATDTIANVLQMHGVSVDLSCEQGMCGACLTRVIDGCPDHRDIVLSEAERTANNQMTICCSRSSSALLVLDL